VTAARETVEQKAVRYVGEHRVAVDVAEASMGMISALVQGGEPIPYHVTHTMALGWRCNCRYAGACCHVAAVRLVFPDPAPTEAAAAGREASAERGRKVLERIGAGAEETW
jgi:uncharacterized Zn finger protein